MIYGYMIRKKKWKLLNNKEGEQPGYIGKSAYGVFNNKLFIFMGERYDSFENCIYFDNSVWALNLLTYEWAELIKSSDKKIAQKI